MPKVIHTHKKQNIVKNLEGQCISFDSDPSWHHKISQKQIKVAYACWRKSGSPDGYFKTIIQLCQNDLQVSDPLTALLRAPFNIELGPNQAKRIDDPKDNFDGNYFNGEMTPRSQYLSLAIYCWDDYETLGFSMIQAYQVHKQHFGNSPSTPITSQWSVINKGHKKKYIKNINLLFNNLGSGFLTSEKSCSDESSSNSTSIGLSDSLVTTSSDEYSPNKDQFFIESENNDWLANIINHLNNIDIKTRLKNTNYSAVEKKIDRYKTFLKLKDSEISWPRYWNIIKEFISVIDKFYFPTNLELFDDLLEMFARKLGKYNFETEVPGHVKNSIFKLATNLILVTKNPKLAKYNARIEKILEKHAEVIFTEENMTAKMFDKQSEIWQELNNRCKKLRNSKQMILRSQPTLKDLNDLDDTVEKKPERICGCAVM